MGEVELKHLQISQLDPHPENPRIIYREDTVEKIKEQIIANRKFGKEHAILVRPKDNGRYEIISGHQRTEAAKRAGFAGLPAWIKDLSDEEAYMQLVLDNNQSELSRVEIGIHVHRFIDKEVGGAGKKGGVSEYSKKIGLSEAEVRRLKNAGCVFLETKTSSAPTKFYDKAYHLNEIYSAPKITWKILLEHSIKNELPHRKLREAVKVVKEFNIPEQWQELFLPYEEVIEEYLKNKKFDPDYVQKLVEEVEAIESELDVQDAKKFREWLAQNAGEGSWDIKRIYEIANELLPEKKETPKVEDVPSTGITEQSSTKDAVKVEGFDEAENNRTETVTDEEEEVGSSGEQIEVKKDTPQPTQNNTRTKEYDNEDYTYYFGYESVGHEMRLAQQAISSLENIPKKGEERLKALAYVVKKIHQLVGEKEKKEFNKILNELERSPV
jgi:ParB/RepB/Spo0J family partition protein